MINLDDYSTNEQVLILGLMQIPNLELVIQAIKQDKCCLTGEIIGEETGYG